MLQHLALRVANGMKHVAPNNMICCVECCDCLPGAKKMQNSFEAELEGKTRCIFFFSLAIAFCCVTRGIFN